MKKHFLILYLIIRRIGDLVGLLLLLAAILFAIRI
jgi:hypothetical protein